MRLEPFGTAERDRRRPELGQLGRAELEDRGPLHEVEHAEARGKPCRPGSRQHVIGPGNVVADRLRGVRAEKDRTRVADLRREPLAIGGIEDHVHLLVRFPPSVAIAALVKEVKGASSHLMTHRLSPEVFFKWQGGYGVVTFGTKDLAWVKASIRHQKEHHARGTIYDRLERVLPLAAAAEAEPREAP